MDTDRWKQIELLLHATLEQPASEQEEYLRRACAEDADLLAEVRSLLAAHREGGGFLDSGLVSPADMPTQTMDAVTARTRFRSMVGETVSHYRVLSRVGSGGMGVVYEAEDVKLGRRVAMKFLPGEVASDRNAFERMQREARAASALDHPNICSIYELGEEDGQPFIVMQLLEGETLREWIEHSSKRDKRTRLSQAINLAVQITRGLEAAHEKNIIHRDIKPANIFVTVRGEVKILDFGLAKVVEEEQQAAGGEEDLTGSTAVRDEGPELALTRTGAKMGTAFYMSPEQIRGERLDARSDLFSLGLVLFEMVTGLRAFAGNTGAVVHEAVLHGVPKAARQINPGVSAGVERILARSLEKDRERRYQSASELRADLERVNMKSSALTSTGAKAALALVALAAVVLGANVGGIRDRFLRLPASRDATGPVVRRRAVAVLGFKNLSGRDDEAWISTALSEMLEAQLSSGEQLRVIPSEDVARMKIDLGLPPADSYGRDTLRKVRDRLAADVVVLGSYLDTGKDSGGKIRVDLQVQDAAAGETIAVISRDGTEADLPQLATQGGAGLRQKLGIADVSTTEATQVAASAPANPEATRLYAEGLAKLHVYDALAARDLLEKAIARDPNHALSHAALAEAWAQLGYEKKAEEEAKKAFDLSGNLPREQHLAIEGHYREFARDFAAAIEIYRTLRNFFPDNLDYALRLASSQNKAGHPKDSLDTVAQMRLLPKPVSDDARIDLAEEHAQGSSGNFEASQKAAAAATLKAKAEGSLMVQAQATSEEAFAWDRLGDLNKAASEAAESRDLASRSGNPFEAARSVRYLGVILYDKGDFAGAANAFREALAICQKIGARLFLAKTLISLGNVYYDQGNLLEAKRYYEQALPIDREISADPADIGSDLGSIANVLDGLGDLAGATKMQEESLQRFRDGGDQRGESDVLNNLGNVLTERGELKKAMVYYEQAIALAQKIGYKAGGAVDLEGPVSIFFDRDQLAQARQREEQVISLKKEVGDTVQIAQSQTELARVALEQGNIAEAEGLVQAASPRFQQETMTAAGSQTAALLARILLAQKKIAEAKAAADTAVVLSGRTSDRSTYIMAALSAAEVNAAAGKQAAAAKSLHAVLNEAARDGYKQFEFEARLDLGQLELASGAPSGRQRLQQLQEEASHQEFLLIARKARAELDRDSARAQAAR